MPDDHEVRELRYQLAQADEERTRINKERGKQGDTIHRLRGELAEVRELHSKIERGEIRSLERLVASLQENVVKLAQDNARLVDKLWGEQPDDTSGLLATAPQLRQ